METRANFVLIGAFTLAAILGAFAFIMWIAGYGASGTHRHYQVIFDGSVSGLSVGSNVLFNGLKVGEVIESPVRQGQSRSGDRRHRRDERERADQRQHQGAARNAGADGHRRGRAEGRRSEGRGGADRQSAGHPVAADGDAGRPADQGRLRARSRQQGPGRQRRRHPPDGRQRPAVLDGARPQRRAGRRGAGQHRRSRQDHRAARQQGADPV